MSLTSLTNRNDYTGNGTTNDYDYTFRIFANTDLLVTVRDPDTDVETTLTLATHYTVSGVGDAGGGQIALVNGAFAWLDAEGDLKTSWHLTIRRVRPLTQTTDIRNQGDFFAETHEDVFDHLVMIAQQQQNELARSLKFPETSTSAGVNVPEPAANKYLGWNAAGNNLENKTPSFTSGTFPGLFTAGTDAAKPASPTTNDVYLATDTKILYICFASGTWTKATTLYGLDAAKPASPAVGEVYLATDTTKLYLCLSAGVWTFYDTSQSKVKASSGDATPGFLDAKVNTASIEVSSNLLQLKSTLKSLLDFKRVSALPPVHSCLGGAAFIVEDGALRVCGNDLFIGIGQGGDLYLPGVASIPTAVAITKVYFAYNNIFAIDANGWVFGAGENAEGELADGGTSPSYVFKRIGTLTGVTKLVISRSAAATAAVSVYAITSGNALYVWGNNTAGQLGVNSTANVLTPTLVAGSWSDIAAAGTATGGFAIGLKTDGTVWATGDNAAGQLGLNDTTDRLVFTQISTLSALVVSKIYAAGNTTEGSSYFVINSGALYASGDNAQGQLCQGNTTDSLIPIVIASVTGVSELVVLQDEGYTSVAAIKTDGTVRTWGNNSQGQLGDNSLIDRTTAYDPSLTGITKGVAIGSGNYGTIYFLKSDGTIYSCGYNGYGQLGIGHTTDKATFQTMLPVKGITVSDITGGVSAASTHWFMVLTTDGRVFSCGYNGFGHLGSGTASPQHTLQPVHF